MNRELELQLIDEAIQSGKFTRIELSDEEIQERKIDRVFQEYREIARYKGGRTRFHFDQQRKRNGKRRSQPSRSLWR